MQEVEPGQLVHWLEEGWLVEDWLVLRVQLLALVYQTLLLSCLPEVLASVWPKE